MKISAAFRNAWKAWSRHPAAVLKFLLVEACLTLICAAPLLFLADGKLSVLALLAIPLWILIMFPARVNAAAAMQDSLEGDRLFSLRLADPSDWGGKVLCGLKRAVLMLIWGAPMIAGLWYAWAHFTGTVDAFTLLRMIQDFGSGDTMTGVIRLLLIFLGMLLVLMIGFGFHSGARHAYALGDRGRMKGFRGKNLLCWICALISLLPLIVAVLIVGIRYWALLQNISAYLTGVEKLPSMKPALIILGIGGVLTLPLLPLRSLITAAFVNGIRPRDGTKE